jgi:hypothetical protein
MVAAECQVVSLSGGMKPFKSIGHQAVLNQSVRIADMILLGFDAFPPLRQKKGARTGHGAFVGLDGVSVGYTEL